MGNPQKAKGSAFERLAVDLLNELVEDSEWKRVPGSGAIGTSLDEPLLTADIVGKVNAIPKKFRVECKVGYGGATQFALKKEWLDKVTREANANFATPLLVGKFSGARAKDGVQVFAVLDIETFASVLNHITYLQKQLDTELKSRTESST